MHTARERSLAPARFAHHVEHHASSASLQVLWACRAPEHTCKDGSSPQSAHVAAQACPPWQAWACLSHVWARRLYAHGNPSSHRSQHAAHACPLGAERGSQSKCLPRPSMCSPLRGRSRAGMDRADPTAAMDPDAPSAEVQSPILLNVAGSPPRLTPGRRSHARRSHARRGQRPRLDDWSRMFLQGEPPRPTPHSGPRQPLPCPLTIAKGDAARADSPALLRLTNPLDQDTTRSAVRPPTP